MKIHSILLVTLISLASASSWAANIKVSVKGETLAFEPATFSVKAGEQVTLTFVNASKSMQHNLVITKPGMADKVTADSISAGADKNWTSVGPEVLFKIKMVDPTKTEVLKFDAPKEKGDYPFLCTFPGHGQVMRGKMQIK